MPGDFYQDQEGKTSEFNSAALKMKRLDKLFNMLNEINGNLQAYNVEYGKYNFELKLSVCNSLFLEVEAQLTKDEKEEGYSLKNAIETCLDRYPIYKIIKDMYSNKNDKKLNKQTWKVFEKWLFKYESLVRKFHSDHGMDTKFYEEDEDEY